MFKSVQIGVALTFLSQDAQAAKVSYRPTPGSTPWYKTTTSNPSWQEPTWPVNYFVPNFGTDKEILSTQSNIAATEEKLGTTLLTSFAKPTPPPRDYFVPNFGKDHDIAMTDLNLGEAEEQHDHKLQVLPAVPANPQNYFVPNFGLDNEIDETKKSLAISEKKLDLKFEGFTQPTPHPTNYFIPNFGMDKDIKDSLANTVSSEGILKHKWDVKTLQLDADINIESDPLCSTAGCTQYLHPAPKDSTEFPPPAAVGYTVPNFGKDSDIETTANSLEIAEKTVNHTFVMGTPEQKAKYAIKAKEIPYDYKPALDEDVISTQGNIKYSEDKLAWNALVQMRDDPICSTAGCTQYKHPSQKAQYPMDYVVPNFGADSEMADHSSNLAKTEALLGKKFNPKLKEDPHPVDYKVPNFGVDQDIKDASSNIAGAEADYGVWAPKQDANGVWQVPQPIDANLYTHSAGHVDHY